MAFFRYFRAVSFDHILQRKRKFSASKSNSEVASFRTKIEFLWMFCAPETANPLLNWGKKTRLDPVVESLVSNVQTTIFLSKISEKLPLFGDSKSVIWNKGGNLVAKSIFDQFRRGQPRRQPRGQPKRQKSWRFGVSESGEFSEILLKKMVFCRRKTNKLCRGRQEKFFHPL